MTLTSSKTAFVGALVLAVAPVWCDPGRDKAIAELQGTWETGYIHDPDGSDYWKFVLTIKDQTFVRRHFTLREDASGNVIEPAFNVIETAGSFDVGAASTTPSGERVRAITWRTEQATLTCLDDPMTAWANSQTFCGAADWVTNVPKDVMDCAALGMDGSPRVSPDIFAITGTSLCLGASSGPDQEPSLSTDCYTKQ